MTGCVELILRSLRCVAVGYREGARPRGPAMSGQTSAPEGAASTEWLRAWQVMPGCSLAAVAAGISDLGC